MGEEAASKLLATAGEDSIGSRMLRRRKQIQAASIGKEQCFILAINSASGEGRNISSILAPLTKVYGLKWGGPRR